MVCAAHWPCFLCFPFCGSQGGRRNTKACRGTLKQAAYLSRRTWLLRLVAGVMVWIMGSALYTVALQHVGLAKTLIIGAMSPLFALSLSYPFLHEWPTRPVLLGTAITVVGIAFVL